MGGEAVGHTVDFADESHRVLIDVEVLEGEKHEAGRRSRGFVPAKPEV